MAPEEKFIEMLSSSDPQVRYMALEQLQCSLVTSTAIVEALVRATRDEDPGISQRAVQALRADIHQQMANKMGIVGFDQITEPVQSKEDQTKAVISPPMETPKAAIKQIEPINAPYPVIVPNWLQYGQAITFILSLIGLFSSLEDPTGFLKDDGWIFIPIVVIYFGIQTYVSVHYGFKESFQFIGVIFNFFFTRRRR